MARRDPRKRDIERVETSLKVISDAIDDAVDYLARHPWKEESVENRANAFRFSSALVDKVNEWTSSYMEKCGIMDIYNAAMDNQKRERKGQISGGIGEVLKGLSSDVKY